MWYLLFLLMSAFAHGSEQYCKLASPPSSPEQKNTKRQKPSKLVSIAPIKIYNDCTLQEFLRMSEAEIDAYRAREHDFKRSKSPEPKN